MNHAETELEELMHALESLERRMTLMQYRVARLKRETRTIRVDADPKPPAQEEEKVRLRNAADRLRRFATGQLPPVKRNLH